MNSKHTKIIKLRHLAECAAGSAEGNLASSLAARLARQYGEPETIRVHQEWEQTLVFILCRLFRCCRKGEHLEGNRADEATSVYNSTREAVRERGRLELEEVRGIQTFMDPLQFRHTWLNFTNSVMGGILDGVGREQVFGAEEVEKLRQYAQKEPQKEDSSPQVNFGGYIWGLRVALQILLGLQGKKEVDIVAEIG